jgi:cytochrome c553
MKILTQAVGILLAGSISVSMAADKPAPDATSEKQYTVVDGDKVDQNTLKGWKTWRALACGRCHGSKQEGMVGPSLINSLKVLSQDDFRKVLWKGGLSRACQTSVARSVLSTTSTISMLI